MKISKTNAMRLLDREKIDYEVKTYNPDAGLDGNSVAHQLGENENQVFKTLVTTDGEGYYVFLVPVCGELQLKKAAKSVNVKKIEMLPQKELKNLTGYVHGGCSPVGMKKLFPTVIDESAKDFDYIYVSGGKIGVQIKINPIVLKDFINGEFDNIRI